MTWRAVVETSEVACSPSWVTEPLAVTVVVATCGRAGWLVELLAALTAQDMRVEIVIVDDASEDDTPQVLRDLLTGCELPAVALRTVRRAGPSAARNAGASLARGTVLLVTDDDCVPEPGWARALCASLAAGVLVAQGRTLPVDVPHATWDRSIRVDGLSGLYETCNLGLDAAAFRQAGGFADLGLLSGTGSRGFGEDAELGSRLAQQRAAAWSPDAVVRHRWIAGTYRDHLSGRARLQGFPALAKLVPELDQRLVGGVGLSRRTLMTDAAVAGFAVAALAGPWPMLAALPWLTRLRRDARSRPGRGWPVRAIELGAADLVGAAALLRGSVRARKLIV